MARFTPIDEDGAALRRTSVEPPLVLFAVSYRRG